MSIGRLALAGLLVTALASGAGANGRDPYASTINFKAGDPTHIMAGMTFGLIKSDDGGATWQWYCEKNVGYGGTYDPDYSYTSTGAVFATTFDGLRVMRDGCSFVSTPPGMTFVSRVTHGPDGKVYFAASSNTPLDTKIYRSTDDGVTFGKTASGPPGMTDGDWWESLEIAPSNANRAYLTGYRLPMKCTSNSSNPGTACTVSTECPGGMCEPQKQLLGFRSDDAANATTFTFTAMDITDITPTTQNSAIDIVGIDPVDEDIVYARLTYETATSGDSIWKSTDGGQNWTKIFSKSSNIGSMSFLVRADRSCVAGTRDMGAYKTAGGATGCGTMASWTAITGAPHIGCLYSRPTGTNTDEVWACTQNNASPQLGITSDGYGIMKSADLTTWTGVLRFEDISCPVSCGAGSVQEDQCVQKFNDMQSPWCCLTSQIGVANSCIDCSGELACFGPSPEAAADAPTTKMKDPGCCDATSGPPVGLTLLVGGLLVFRRRRRTVSAT